MEEPGRPAASKGKTQWKLATGTTQREEELLQWYDEAKVGIFIHFGVYAVPGFRSEWFWCFWQCPDRIHPPVVDFMKKNYRPGFTYQDFAADFKLV